MVNQKFILSLIVFFQTFNLVGQSFYKEIDIKNRNEFCVSMEEYEGNYYALINSFDHSQSDYRINSRSIILQLDSNGGTLDSLFLYHADSNILWSALKVLSDHSILLCGELFCNSDTARLILRRYDANLNLISAKILGSDSISYLINGVIQLNNKLVFLGGRNKSSTLICTDLLLDSIYSHIIPNTPQIFQTGNYSHAILGDSVIVFLSFTDQLDSSPANTSLWHFNVNNYDLQKLNLTTNFQTSLLSLSDGKLGIIDVIDNMANDTIINGQTLHYSDLRIRTFDLNTQAFVSDSCICIIGSSEYVQLYNSSWKSDQINYVIFNINPILFTQPDFYSDLGIMEFDILGKALNKIIIPWSKPLSALSVSGTANQLVLGGTANFTYLTQSQNVASAFIMGMDRDFSSVPSALGISNIPEKGLFVLYPNPANGYFHIANPNNLTIDYVECYNSKGVRVLHTQEINQIPLPEISGVYIVRIVTKSGKVFYSKIVNTSQ